MEHFQLGQRGQEIPRLTGALSALDDESAFLRHLTLLADGLGVAPAAIQANVSDTPLLQEASTDEDTDVGPDSGERAPETVSDGEDGGVAAPSGRSGLRKHGTRAGSAHALPGGARTLRGRPAVATRDRAVSGTTASLRDLTAAVTTRPQDAVARDRPRRAAGPPITSGCWSFRARDTTRTPATQLLRVEAPGTITARDRRCSTTRSTAAGKPRQCLISSRVSTCEASMTQAGSGESR